MTAAFPDIARKNYRPGAAWPQDHQDQAALDAWRAGQTGIPIVDAGLRQAQRFDHDGRYVRRYVPELVGLDPADIQTPWKLAPIPGYPRPIVELS